MSTISVSVASPAANTVVPRQFQVTGSIFIQRSPKRGPIISQWVSVQFGDGGPVFNGTFTSATTWTCTGQVAANVPPAAFVHVNVTAGASIRVLILPGEPDIEDVEGSTVSTVQIYNPAPLLSINAVPADTTATQLPFPFTLTGTISDADVNVTSVQCALDLGAFENVTSVAGNWASWRKDYNLGAGLHRFIVRAVDAGGNQAQQQAFMMVHPPGGDVPDPGTASIPIGTRLEPHCRDADIGRSISARLFDPLWLMARQWQMGEFQAADAGTPVQARVRATTAMLSRLHLGEIPANTPNAPSTPYDPRRIPLEAMIERRRMRPAGPTDTSMLTFAVEAGLQFLRMVEYQAPSKSYRNALIAKFALPQLQGADAAAADEATRRFMQSMTGRAPDARLIAAALRPAGGIAQLVQDATLAIVTADRPKVQTAATAWIAWHDALFAEPASPADDAWAPSRLEYAATVSASFSDQPLDQINLAATGFDGGRLDWSSFDCDFEINMSSNVDHTFSSVTETTIPAPVTYRGAPAVRFWEIEDSRLAYGLLPVAQTDLAHMMVIEYAGSYGNDWFVVPLTLPVGSINRVDSLVVTDSFGVRTLLKPIGTWGTVARSFFMWQHANIRRPGAEDMPGRQNNMLFLPPAIGQVMQSAALEDVLFMRDEMANMAWAIERSIENPTEQARIYREPAPAPGVPAPIPANTARYVLSSSVPGNWIPLLPVQTRSQNNNLILRLKRGRMLQIDGGPPTPHPSQSQALNTGADLLLYDCDVPREGVHVTRARRTSRWTDGSTFVWTAFRKQVGRGEGSSGLEFDQLIDGNSRQ
jgi:hypothetical protein